jgi:hypothetical protein
MKEASDELFEATKRAIRAYGAAKDAAIKVLVARGVAMHRISAWKNFDTMEQGLAVDADHRSPDAPKPACTIRAMGDGSLVTTWHEPWAVVS